MIERTQDYRRVKALAPEWDLTVSDKVFYLAVVDHAKDVGVICFHPCDEDGMLMHVMLGNDCRGLRAANAYRAAFSWMFANTGHSTLLGRIPKIYRHARVMARNIGSRFDGIDMDGLMCYSLNKAEFEKRDA